MAKILSLVPYKIFPAQVGGQKGIALFNEYLAKEADLLCVTVKNNDPQYAKGYQVLNILSTGASRYINLFYFFTLKKIIRQHAITHLILEHPYYGWLGILLKKFTGIKLVVHSHNIEAVRWKTLKKWWWKILYQYEKCTHRNADYNFFIQHDDKEYAIAHYRLRREQCITVTYGIDWEHPPQIEERLEAKRKLKSIYAIAPEETILLFNGSFNYSPNADALTNIISHINPLLKQLPSFSYKIIIAGKGIDDKAGQQSDNIIYAGFVEDISLYFKGADIFINPVIEGGGIKTKLVEALGHNMNAVSTVNGAIGVDPLNCNGKLLICADEDWQQFAALVREAADIHADIPPAYFDHFFWGSIVRNAVTFIQQ